MAIQTKEPDLELHATQRPATDVSLTAIVAAGITMRGWQQPHHYFNKRKITRDPLKTELGWTDPRNINASYLRLVVTDDDMHTAWNTVLMLGQHGICVNNGWMMSE